MKIDYLTLFPEMFEGVLNHSILKRAQDKESLMLILSISEIILLISIIKLMITHLVVPRYGIKA